MDCEKVNKVALKADFLPTVKIVDLNNDKEYKITKMRLGNTKFGTETIVELDGMYQIYLPERVSTIFVEDQRELEIYQTVAKLGRLYIRFLDVKTGTFMFIPKAA